MSRLRSRLYPEEQRDFVEGPTRYKVGPNQLELICGLCNRTYYVDDLTLQHALSAIKEGIDNPFCCDECDAEREELSH